uniref:Uncharacterized protein n=1 Tax=Anguilla anguilla TaxID=7936 RepID=A0A0E9RPP8_ANGAN
MLQSLLPLYSLMLVTYSGIGGALLLFLVLFCLTNFVTPYYSEV